MTDDLTTRQIAGEEGQSLTYPSSIIPSTPMGVIHDGSPPDKEGAQGGDYPSLNERVMEEGFDIIGSATLLQQAKERLKAAPPEIWGPFIKSSALTMLVGETSAGKTVLLYNLAYHLATGKEFLGFTPRTGFKVLYVDFEGNDETRVLTMEAIGTDDEHWHVVVPLAHFYELAPGDRGPELIQRLRATLRRCNYQVVVVDSLMEAYPVEDENNNDQANAQMVAFRRVAVETGAAIVLVHNTGLKKKNDRNPGKKGLARGASSRVDRADIVLNYTAKTEEERVLTIAKTRWNNLNEQVLLRFNENLGYEVVSSSAVSETAITKMCSEALSLMKEALKQGRIEVTRNSMMEYLGIAEKTARSIALDRALRRLFNSGAITKPRKGVYSLAISISG